MSSTYKASWGNIYNLNHIATVKDMSGKMRPYYRVASRNHYRTFWQILTRKNPNIVKGDIFLDGDFGCRKATIEEATFKYAVRVWTSLSNYPKDWEFDTEQEKDEFLVAFQTFQDNICRIPK